MSQPSTSPVKLKSNIKHTRKSSGQGPDQVAPGLVGINVGRLVLPSDLPVDEIELQAINVGRLVLPSDLPVDEIELQCLLSDLARRTNSVAFEGIRPRWDGQALAVQELVKRLARVSGVDLANRQQLLGELQAALETMQRRSSVPTQPAISTSEIVAEYLESIKPNLAPASFITYSDILHSFARAFPELPQEPEPVERYMTYSRRPEKDGSKKLLAAGTRRLIYSKLSGLYQFANKRRGARNVMELIGRPAKGKGKESDYLTLDQFKALWEAIPRRPRSDRLRAYVALCAGQGLRSEEPTRENVEDIFQDRLRIRQTAGKERGEWIPLLPEVRDAVLKICQGRMAGPIFIGETGRGRLGREQMKNEVRDLFREAGIAGIMAAPKVLRHTFNTLTQKASHNRAATEALMRHRTKNVNDLYTHLSIDERLDMLRPVLQQYSPLRQLDGRDRDLSKSTG